MVERSGFVESRHYGAAVVLAPDGSVERARGAVSVPIFPRSTLKPLQASVCLALGADLHGDQAGLATASHSGTPEHIAVVEAILDGGGLDAGALRCPPAWPGDAAARRAWAGEGGQPDRIHMNCSGKHAAMLRACLAQGWPTETYLNPDHPLQQQIAATLTRVSGEPVHAVGVDGCGAPLFAVSLVALARTIHWAVTAEDRVKRGAAAAPGAGQPEAGAPEAGAPETSTLDTGALDAAAARIVAAVLEHPWTIDGPGRENTLAIQHFGSLAKGGAEGVLVLTAPDRRVVALKVLDGSMRPATLVALELLVQAGSLERSEAAAFLPNLDLEIRGGDAVVGAIRCSL